MWRSDCLEYAGENRSYHQDIIEWRSTAEIYLNTCLWLVKCALCYWCVPNVLPYLGLLLSVVTFFLTIFWVRLGPLGYRPMWSSTIRYSGQTDLIPGWVRSTWPVSDPNLHSTSAELFFPLGIRARREKRGWEVSGEMGDGKESSTTTMMVMKYLARGDVDGDGGCWWWSWWGRRAGALVPGTPLSLCSSFSDFPSSIFLLVLLFSSLLLLSFLFFFCVWQWIWGISGFSFSTKQMGLETSDVGIEGSE